jgi:hypothetical protein
LVVGKQHLSDHTVFVELLEPAVRIEKAIETTAGNSATRTLTIPCGTPEEGLVSLRRPPVFVSGHKGVKFILQAWVQITSVLLSGWPHMTVGRNQ